MRPVRHFFQTGVLLGSEYCEFPVTEHNKHSFGHLSLQLTSGKWEPRTSRDITI